MTETTEARRSGPFGWFVGALFTLGFLARIAPLFNQGNRVFWQYPTEDGYLMMGIARHLALGNGFATADGSIPTNGTQPLVTLVQSAWFWLVGGDRFWGVLGCEVMLLVAAVAAAWLLARFAERIFAGYAHAHRAAWLLAAVWFASSVFVRHSMNCLETGPYALVVILVARTFVESDEEARRLWSWGRCAGVGVLLGLAFWTRNDAVFLILAACLTHVWSGWRAGGLELAKAHFGRSLVFGSVSVAVAAPWMAFNYLGFGHIMPVSGRAENLTASFGDNTALVGPQLFEYMLAVLPIPQFIEQQPLFIAFSFLTVAGFIGLVAKVYWPRANETARRVIVLGGLYAGCISLFYGLYFGAGWFIPRYFYPFTPLMMLVWGPAVFWLLDRVRIAFLPQLAAVGVLLLFAATSAREYRAGSDHMHDQVVHWAQDNLSKLPDPPWIAAVQTGTLNFFYDRTLNLDGKVNPAAFEALKRSKETKKDLRLYLRDEARVIYFVDWLQAVQDWVNTPELKDHFEIILEVDGPYGLGVARRIEGTEP